MRVILGRYKDNGIPCLVLISNDYSAISRGFRHPFFPCTLRVGLLGRREYSGIGIWFSAPVYSIVSCWFQKRILPGALPLSLYSWDKEECHFWKVFGWPRSSIVQCWLSSAVVEHQMIIFPPYFHPSHTHTHTHTRALSLSMYDAWFSMVW